MKHSKVLVQILLTVLLTLGWRADATPLRLPRPQLDPVEQLKGLIENKGLCYITYADGQKRDRDNLSVVQSLFLYTVASAQRGSLAGIRATSYHERVGESGRHRDKTNLYLEWSAINFAQITNVNLVTRNAAHSIQPPLRSIDFAAVLDESSRTGKSVPLDAPTQERLSSWVNYYVEIHLNRPIKVQMYEEGKVKFEEAVSELSFCFATQRDAESARALLVKISQTQITAVAGEPPLSSNSVRRESLDISEASLKDCRDWFEKLPHLNRNSTEINRIFNELIGMQPREAVKETVKTYLEIKGSEIPGIWSVLDATQTFKLSRGAQVLEDLGNGETKGFSQQDLFEAIAYLRLLKADPKIGSSLAGALDETLDMRTDLKRRRVHEYTGFCGVVFFIVFW